MKEILFNQRDLEIIDKFIKAYHNDQELGAQIRHFFQDNTYVKSFFNDEDLGKNIRKNFQNIKK